LNATMAKPAVWLAAGESVPQMSLNRIMNSYVWTVLLKLPFPVSKEPQSAVQDIHPTPLPSFFVKPLKTPPPVALNKRSCVCGTANPAPVSGGKRHPGGVRDRANGNGSLNVRIVLRESHCRRNDLGPDARPRKQGPRCNPPRSASDFEHVVCVDSVERRTEVVRGIEIDVDAQDVLASATGERDRWPARTISSLSRWKPDESIGH